MAMFKAFKPSGMEKIARSMGYQGNMQGFQDYLAQDPMRQQQMQGYTRQAMQMARGGIVKRMQEGGDVTTDPVPTPEATNTIGDVTAQRMYNPMLPEQGVVEVASVPRAGEQDISQTGVTAQKPTQLTATQAEVSTPEYNEYDTTAKTMSPDLVQEDVSGALEKLKAAQGEVSEKAQVKAEQGELSPEALASVPRMEDKFIEKASSKIRTVQDTELATAAGKDAEAIRTEVAQSDLLADAKASQGIVSERELPPPAQIAEEDMAQAKIITADGLADDARMVAAKLEKFTVDNETLAKAAQGDVDAKSTVQGQLKLLMKDFDDGTPAWSAGALRAANAAMLSRGLGGSSVASAAIVQAVMESAIPIAEKDAAVFENMQNSNLNRQQEVALANAAAQQGVEISNLNNQQQANLNNTARAFDVQMQNLTNTQSAVLANAQIKATLQGQNLSNQQQSNIVTAARYAENANINLNFEQQTSLQNNSNKLQTNLANLSSKQQAYVTNAQIAASLQGKVIDNEQQVAIQNSAKFSEANNITFTAEQQTTLHNSELMKTIGLANLSSEQASVLQNAATIANMDMANLNNRQQASVQNAKAFLEMDMANMSNEQQTAVFKTQQLVQSIFSDQAAENASAQFNATSENQVTQFFSQLDSANKQFSSAQTNAMAQFNAGEVNAIAKFITDLDNVTERFNAQNKLIINQADAQWRKEIALQDTAAVNRANEINAQSTLDISKDAYNNLWRSFADTMEWAWQSADNDANRSNAIATALISKDAEIAKQTAAQTFQSDASQSSFLTNVMLGVTGKVLGIPFFS
jgi:hypothetical protein